jgi:hypothetical protein
MKKLKALVINQPAYKTQNKWQDHSKVTNEEEWSSHLLMEYSWCAVKKGKPTRAMSQYSVAERSQMVLN